MRKDIYLPTSNDSVIAADEFGVVRITYKTGDVLALSPDFLEELYGISRKALSLTWSTRIHPPNFLDRETFVKRCCVRDMDGVVREVQIPVELGAEIPV